MKAIKYKRHEGGEWEDIPEGIDFGNSDYMRTFRAREIQQMEGIDFWYYALQYEDGSEWDCDRGWRDAEGLYLDPAIVFQPDWEKKHLAFKRAETYTKIQKDLWEQEYSASPLMKEYKAGMVVSPLEADLVKQREAMTLGVGLHSAELAKRRQLEADLVMIDKQRDTYNKEWLERYNKERLEKIKKEEQLCSRHLWE